MIWANLLHLSYNMWEDRTDRRFGDRSYQSRLRFHDKLWKQVLARMEQAGMNMLVIDLGDGVRYLSHPEIAVSGAWTTQRLQRELTRLRKAGLEPIPKLNFSTCHDAWLGPYSRCVSTDIYYQVCRDLIAKVIDLFDRPRFFHLGMDEETAPHQRSFQYVVIRQFDLWWHDLYFYVNEVERRNVRPWIWADYAWKHPEVFYKKMPHSVLQSNWYYGHSFSCKLPYVQTYLDLEAHGYDQIPTASNHSNPDNFAKTARFVRKHVAPEHLLGLLQTPWRPTLSKHATHHREAVDQVAQARSKWNR